MFASLYKVIEQLFSKKVTNVFPTVYKPDSVAAVLKSGKINPPIAVPKDFRGRLQFDYDKCIGCGMCEKVCPAKAIELYPVIEKEKKTKKIVMFLSRCTYCSECVVVCPRNAISMSSDFMLADYDKFSSDAVVGSAERQANEIKEA